MAEISLETAQSLLGAGKINQKTYDLLAANANSKNPAPEVKQDLIVEPAPEIPEPAPQPIVNRQPMAQTPAAVPQEAAPVLASDVVPQQSQTPAQFQPANIAKGVDESFKAMQNATVKGAAAGMQQASQEAAYLQNANANFQRMEQDRRLQESIRQQAMKEKTDKLQLMVDQFGEGKVDPNRFWKDRTTGQKVLTGIGLFLGAFGSNANSAVKTVQDAINRDIESQKLELDKGRVGVQLQNNVLASMREQFGDERAAEAATRLAALGQVDTQLRAVAAQYRSPQIQAQAEQAFAQLELAKQKEMMNFSNAIQSSPSFTQMDGMMRDVMTKVPEKMRGDAIKELGEYNGIKQSQAELGRLYSDMAKQQGVSNRLLNPIQSRSILATAEANLFDVVKKIVGERMTDADARTLIKPFVVNLTDNEETIKTKQANLMRKLENKISERTPTLTGLGIIPKAIKTGAPVR